MAINDGNIGNDLILGGGANDTLIGVQGNDTILGGGGDDLIIGDQYSENFVYISELDFAGNGEFPSGEFIEITFGTGTDVLSRLTDFTLYGYDTAPSSATDVQVMTSGISSFFATQGSVSLQEIVDAVGGLPTTDGQTLSLATSSTSTAALDLSITFHAAVGDTPAHYTVVLPSSGTSGPSGANEAVSVALVDDSTGQVLDLYDYGADNQFNYIDGPAEGMTAVVTGGIGSIDPDGNITNVTTKADLTPGDSQLDGFAFTYDDTLSGSGGNDTIYGQQGNDTIFGDEGNDIINGNDGNDIIFGDGKTESFAFVSEVQYQGGGEASGEFIEITIADDPSLLDQLGNFVIQGYTSSAADPFVLEASTDNFSSFFPGQGRVTLQEILDAVGGTLPTVDGLTFAINSGFTSGQDLSITYHAATADVPAHYTFVIPSGGTVNTTVPNEDESNAYAFGNIATGDAISVYSAGTVNTYTLADGIAAGQEITQINGGSEIDQFGNFIPTGGIPGSTPGTTNFDTSVQPADDIIDAGEGDDIVDGQEGNDTIDGGAGNDNLSGNVGDDIIDGGDGTDTIDGGDGIDTIQGGDGNDNILGGAGDDIIFGDVNDVGSDVDFTLSTVGSPISSGATPSATWNTTAYSVNGVNYTISTTTGADGGYIIRRIEDDGTQTLIEERTYDSATNTVTSSVFGDVTSEYSDPSMVAEQIVPLIDGDTIFTVEEQNGGLIAYRVNPDGTLQFQDQISTFSGAGGFVSGTPTAVTADDGSVFLYQPRPDTDTIEAYKYDPTSGTFLSADDTPEFTITDVDVRPEGIESLNLAGTEYLAVATNNNVLLYEVDTATGATTLSDSVGDPGYPDGVRNGLDIYTKPDGSTYVAVARTDLADVNDNTVILYEVTDTGDLVETDRIVGAGQFFGTDPSYINGEPVIVVRNISGGTNDLYGIDSDGSLVLIGSTPSLGSEVNATPPTITQSPDGTYYLAQGDVEVGAIELSVNTDTTSSTRNDTISGGDGNDMIFGQDGNDMIAGDAGDDEIDGGVGADTVSGGTGDDLIFVSGGDDASGDDDRDTFVITADDFASGNTITIDGGTGSTAAGDIDDFDEIILGDGLSVVGGSYNASVDEVGVPTTDNTGASASTTSVTGSVQVSDGTNVFTINFQEIEAMICFVRGTKIETMKGPVAVEDLVIGDLVKTKDNGFQSIRWINGRAFTGEMVQNKSHLTPIRIAKDSLGENMPAKDTFVSPQHRILIRSKIAEKMFGAPEVLIAAKRLLRLDGVDYAKNFDEVEYFHFMFDNHEIVNANGMEAESLFTGPEALKAIGEEGVREIADIFPEVLADDFKVESVRHIVDGKRAKKLISRHSKNDVNLWERSV